MKNILINVFGGLALIVIGVVKTALMVVLAIPFGIVILGLTIADWVWPSSNVSTRKS